MIQFTVRLFAPPEKSDEISRAVRCRLGRIRAEYGCLSCHLYEDLEDRRVLGFIALWNDPEDLQRHISTNVFRELLVWLELSMQPQCGAEHLAFLCGFKRTGIGPDFLTEWGPLNFECCGGHGRADGSCALEPGQKRFAMDFAEAPGE